MNVLQSRLVHLYPVQYEGSDVLRVRPDGGDCLCKISSLHSVLHVLPVSTKCIAVNLRKSALLYSSAWWLFAICDDSE